MDIVSSSGSKGPMYTTTANVKQYSKNTATNIRKTSKTHHKHLECQKRMLNNIKHRDTKTDILFLFDLLFDSEKQNGM